MAIGSSDSTVLVKSLETKVLQCAQAIELEPGFEQVGSTVIPTGPADQLVAAFIPIAVTWVYSNTIDNDKLYRACELILDYYPQLTGRLRNRSEDGGCEITALGQGASFVTASCSERLDEAFHDYKDISVARLPGAGNDLMPPFDPSMDGIGNNALFAIQSTSFACGGTVLGIRLPHCVCDGHGYFDFVHNLASLYRQLGSPSQPAKLAQRPDIVPYLAKFALEGEDVLRQARAAKPVMFHLTSDETQATQVPATKDTVTGRVLRFSSQQLKELKKQATGPNPDQWASTFEAIAALLHQSVFRARLRYYGEDNLSPPDFLCPLNYRGRMSNLSNFYFPNFGMTPYTTISQDTMRDGQLWEVAASLHKMIRNDAPTEEQVNTLMKWLAAQPDKRLIRNGFRVGNGSFMISAWTGFNMYEDMELEAGCKPVLVSPPFTSVSLLDGLAYIIPTEARGQMAAADADQGELDVNLALADPLWALLEQDANLLNLCSMSQIS